MASQIGGYNYDIFISYRQRDNKYDSWVTEFVDNLKKELETTFKEEISVYFDINPHDGLLETHDVEASLLHKLKCLIFIPILSRTYCDQKSFAWNHEFKTFVEQSSKDQIGLSVKLSNGNVVNRVLPVRIHDLDIYDIKEVESVLGGFVRGVEFIYKSQGVNRPLRSCEDKPLENSNRTIYRDQINKVTLAIWEIISGVKGESVELGNESSAEASITKKPYSSEESIIVLPFENISADPEQEYFSDGLTEEIISELSHINDLVVISRSSAMTFKRTNKKISEITKEVNVHYALEGSVRIAGNNLRITAQLIDGFSDSHIWAEKYNGTLDDIFSIQEKVSQLIVKSLKLKLVPSRTRIVSADFPVQNTKSSEDKSVIDIKAYNLYLKGRYFSSQHTEEGFKKGINYFNQAIEIEGNYALAHIGLARCYEELSRLSFIPSDDGFHKAKQAIVKALEIDNTIGEAYATLGSLKMVIDWDISGAKDDYEKALELSPGNIDIIKMYTQYLTWTGDFEKGISLARKGLELDPLTPFTGFNLGFIQFYSGKYNDSINQLNEVLILDPKFAWAHMYLAYNHVMKHDFIKGIYYADNAIAVWPTENTTIPFGFMGWVYGKSGHSEKALALLSKLKSMQDNKFFDPYSMAIIYSGLNQNEKTLEWLNKAYESHSGLMLYLKIHSSCFFADLVSDNLYNDLINKIGFSNIS